MDGAPFMPDRQIATRDLREHSRNGETVSNSEFVNSLLAILRGIVIHLTSAMSRGLGGD
jgi:hypothetical protein